VAEVYGTRRPRKHWGRRLLITFIVLVIIVAGGLVKSDTPNVAAALAGLTQDRFFAGIGAEYAAQGLHDPKAQYLFEPKVAERVAWRLFHRRAESAPSTSGAT